MTITIKVDKSTADKMEYFYKDFIVGKPNYTIFQAKSNNTTITLYESLKVVFQGNNATEEAKIWDNSINDNSKSNPKEKSESKSLNNITQKNKNIFYKSAIGSDEVGTGDYFGPMVVCATYVAKEQIDTLLELGIKDSKKVNDAFILKVAPKIIEMIPHSILILDNQKYNHLQRNGINLNKMKAIMHNEALKNVKNSVNNYELIVVDQFAEEKLYYRYLVDEKVIVKDIYFTTKGEDAHLAVACASIIARYSFLKSIDHLSTLVGLDLPKGAGPQVNKVIELLVEKNGIEILEKIAKLHFANTKKVLD